MFRDEEPESDQRAGNLIGQELPYGPFQTEGVTGFASIQQVGAMSVDKYRAAVRAKRVEFFFGARKLQ